MLIAAASATAQQITRKFGVALSQETDGSWGTTRALSHEMADKLRAALEAAGHAATSGQDFLHQDLWWVYVTLPV